MVAINMDNERLFKCMFGAGHPYTDDTRQMLDDMRRVEPFRGDIRQREILRAVVEQRMSRLEALYVDDVRVPIRGGRATFIIRDEIDD